MKVLLLGAGSTIGTFYGWTAGNPPRRLELGVEGYTRRLEQVRPTWRTDYKELAKAVDASGSANLDKVWTYIDYVSKFPVSLEFLGPLAYSKEDGGKILRDLRRSLLDAYSLTEELADLAVAEESFTLKDVLQELRDGDAVISFNWDTAAEHVARELKIPLVAAGAKPGARASAVRLIKPHGSLSWEDREGKPVKWEDDGRPLYEPMSAEDPRLRQRPYVQPLLLGAVPMKSELIIEVQGGGEGNHVYKVIADQWGQAIRAIADATKVTVVGYGFPPEDSYGTFLFRQAARDRNARPLAVTCYCPDDRASDVGKGMLEAFGRDGTTFAFGGPATAAPRRSAKAHR